MTKHNRQGADGPGGPTGAILALSLAGLVAAGMVVNRHVRRTAQERALMALHDREPADTMAAPEEPA